MRAVGAGPMMTRLQSAVSARLRLLGRLASSFVSAVEAEVLQGSVLVR
jgi:hypothetical protein